MNAFREMGRGEGGRRLVFQTDPLPKIAMRSSSSTPLAREGTLFLQKRSSYRLEFQGIVQVHNLLIASGEFKRSSSPTVHLQGINISKEGICLKTDYFFIPNHLF